MIAASPDPSSRSSTSPIGASPNATWRSVDGRSDLVADARQLRPLAVAGRRRLRRRPSAPQRSRRRSRPGRRPPRRAAPAASRPRRRAASRCRPECPGRRRACRPPARRRSPCRREAHAPIALAIASQGPRGRGAPVTPAMPRPLLPSIPGGAARNPPPAWAPISAWRRFRVDSRTTRRRASAARGAGGSRGSAPSRPRRPRRAGAAGRRPRDRGAGARA